jgi:hypothetical protein
VGHALNKILKDMILRVKVQQGMFYDAGPWLPVLREPNLMRAFM